MIKSLRLVNFKNFADETLHLGPFTLIVGANASGKSNIRDAFRFLHGIGRGYTLAETFGGKYDAGWQPIRGAPNEIARFGQGAFALEVEVMLQRFSQQASEIGRYTIRIQRDEEADGPFRVVAESLVNQLVNLSNVNDSGTSNLNYTSNRPGDSRSGKQQEESNLRLYLPYSDIWVEVGSHKPGLTQDGISAGALRSGEQADQMSEELKAGALGWLWTQGERQRIEEVLSNMLFLDLTPERMREPAFPVAARLGNFGDDLPAVLKAVCADQKRKDILLSWLHELAPVDVGDLNFPRDPSGRVHLQILESNGTIVSAYSASDGTLRFLGFLAALLNEDCGGLYFFEEIDNGIHPARLHLLLDLIERQTAKGKIQVVATTHSPDVLNLINDTTFENTSVVYRDEDAADAVIRRVAELPNAKELRKSQGLGRLHTSGWMENILSFAQADEEGQKGSA